MDCSRWGGWGVPTTYITRILLFCSHDDICAMNAGHGVLLSLSLGLYANNLQIK